MKEFRSKRLRVWENINRTMQEFKVLLLGYRSYTALLTQSGTDAPVATVLENTLGDAVTYQYYTVGYYDLILPFDITDTNHAIIHSHGNQINGTLLWCWKNASNKIRIETYDFGNLNITTLNYTTSPQPSDSLLTNHMIEIRVYN